MSCRSLFLGSIVIQPRRRACFDHLHSQVCSVPKTAPLISNSVLLSSAPAAALNVPYSHAVSDPSLASSCVQAAQPG